MPPSSLARHALARRALALAPLLLPGLAACGEKVSPGAAKYAIASSGQLGRIRYVRVPKRRDLGMRDRFARGGMQAWDEMRLARNDPYVGVLHARGLVRIHDVPKEHQPALGDRTRPRPTTVAGTSPFGSPPPTPTTATHVSGWTHVAHYRRLARADDPDWIEDDGRDPQSGRRITAPGEVPGWKVIVSRPEVIDVESRALEGTGTTDVPPGTVSVRFTWRMKTTPTGEPFDRGTEAFRRLPDDLRDAVLRFALDDGEVRQGIAHLRRVGERLEVVRLEY